MNITERIVNHLVMASSLTPDIGLYHGKMGIVIALCRYARFAQKPIYDDFAGELLDEVCSSIHAGKTAWPASGGESNICCKIVLWKAIPTWSCAI